jgi:hypothetical protein
MLISFSIYTFYLVYSHTSFLILQPPSFRTESMKDTFSSLSDQQSKYGFSSPNSIARLSPLTVSHSPSIIKPSTSSVSLSPSSIKPNPIYPGKGRASPDNLSVSHSPSSIKPNPIYPSRGRSSSDNLSFTSINGRQSPENSGYNGGDVSSRPNSGSKLSPISTNIGIYIYIYICIHVYIYAYIYVYVYVYIYIYICIYEYIYYIMYIYNMYIYIYIYTSKSPTSSNVGRNSPDLSFSSIARHSSDSVSTM